MKFPQNLLELKKEIGYGKVYQLSMHAITLPTLWAVVTGLMNIQIPFVYTLILIVFMTYVLKKLGDIPTKIPETTQGPKEASPEQITGISS